MRARGPAGGGARAGVWTSGGTTDSPADTRARNDLKTIGLAFHNYYDATKGNPLTNSMPAGPAGLEKFLGDAPVVAAAVRDGTYTVFWSAPAAQTVIACEKDAEQRGGWVLLRFGDSQKMTAAEVRAAVSPR